MSGTILKGTITVIPGATGTRESKRPRSKTVAYLVNLKDWLSLINHDS